MLRLATVIVVAFATAAVAGPAADVPRPLRDADFRPVDRAEAALGQLLFYDKVISGNRNIACASCHHPRFGTGDGLALSLGEGGTGLGPERVADAKNLPEQRVPRNAQPLFNLGAHEFVHLFHDGRIEVDLARPSALRTPLESEMPSGFDTILAAQTMFPVISPDEMAGHYGENEISVAVRKGDFTGPDGAWALIARRVSSLPAYREKFAALDPEIAAGRPIDFADVSNAIAAFMELEWRSDDSPFDRHLAGKSPLSGAAMEGINLFYGDAGCSGCHSGPLQTDQAFHAVGAPQLGPGKGARFERHARDEGRMEVTGHIEDAYKFRTPSLRNVAITGPWGHAGAHDNLAAFVADHAAPRAAQWPHRAVLPALGGIADFMVRDDAAERAKVLDAIERPDAALTADEVAALVAFLGALTGDNAEAGHLGIPQGVPSGLPVDR